MTHRKLELESVVGGFQQAWLLLLRDDYITSKNIDRVPALLIATILAAASEAALNEDELATVALAHLEELERETTVALN